MKPRFTCNSLNLINVAICNTCKEENIGETGEGKTKLRDRVRVYRQPIRQPQHQQLKVEGHLKIYGNGEFRILLKMRSQNTNLKRSYEVPAKIRNKNKLIIMRNLRYKSSQETFNYKASICSLHNF